ncbi:acetolactate decarboxylase [Megalodesulfovibrio gigas]|uniref:Alpha-acetolactate decarboxylase n=1 Tax=Megalodesulfovibrio gigas (strain ATCC 19364 / DSM 1382 / NCIMB 9332 / VKM B-1759) TaxID=1121448 RepID=T2G8Z3_MEGG1|nr:acetolactate decarboxylase [Megalodesulfovibrio gigas]AGW12639.1 putative acetolactate decarboxylase [Megalodesulfovibrio gigas DSM 1382 = ATCC 19364]
MKYHNRIPLLAVLAVALLAWSCSGEPRAIHQTSTLDALKAGAFAGVVTVETLERQGTLGLGTLDGLDGELVQVDGVAYHVGMDGVARAARPEATIPFATSVRFAPDASRRAQFMPLADLCRLLDELAPDRQQFAAVRVRGRFSSLEARSVPRQSPPYPTLAEVLPRQAVFHLEQVVGDMVGFRFPDHAASYGVAGWHLHFLSTDRTRGGHVLDAVLQDGIARVMTVARLELYLPPGLPQTAGAGAGSTGGHP